MPTFLVGKPLVVYLAGYDFSSSNDEYNASLKVDVLENTTFGPSFHRTNQPGTVEGEVDLKGYYNYTTPPTVTGYENQLAAAVRVDTVGLVVTPQAATQAAGDLADLFVITSVERSIAVKVDEIIRLEAKFKTATGEHIGNVIRPESVATWPSVSYDQGAVPAAGNIQYVVVLQVTAYTSGLAAVVVQTSPDNSSWTTRGTFPAITAIGGYALALNTTLERYVRIGGAGVATLIAAFARIN